MFYVSVAVHEEVDKFTSTILIICYTSFLLIVYDTEHLCLCQLQPLMNSLLFEAQLKGKLVM